MIGRGRLGRLVVGVVAVALVAAACSAGDDDDADGTPPASARRAVCDATAVARPQLAKDELTFAEMVGADENSTPIAGISGVLYWGRMAHAGSLGPYQPAIDYLVERSTAWSEEFRDEVPVPERTHEVEASAARLDRDLADGLCDP